MNSGAHAISIRVDCPSTGHPLILHCYASARTLGPVAPPRTDEDNTSGPLAALQDTAAYKKAKSYQRVRSEHLDMNMPPSAAWSSRRTAFHDLREL
jgi:hypothetical protein